MEIIDISTLQFHPGHFFGRISRSPKCNSWIFRCAGTKEEVYFNDTKYGGSPALSYQEAMEYQARYCLARKLHRNDYAHVGESETVMKLTRGAYLIMDRDVFFLLSRYTWCATSTNGGRINAVQTKTRTENRKYRTMSPRKVLEQHHITLPRNKRTKEADDRIIDIRQNPATTTYILSEKP